MATRYDKMKRTELIEEIKRLTRSNGAPITTEGDRTIELVAANEALKQEIAQRQAAEEELHEAHRRKDEFLAMLGHELRNPLGPISHAVALWRMIGPQDRELEDLQSIVERQVHHMVRIIDDLLDVSRISRGKIVLQKESIELTQLTADVVDDFRSQVETSGLSVEVQLCQGPIWIHGDKTRLAQVIGNLLHNSLKFTPHGGRICVQLGRDASSNQARLMISDTGIGIEPSFLNRVFETFVQTERSLDRSAGGLGLGLALVKGLVQLHGGEVEASSGGPNQGTQVTIRLPMTQPPQPAANKPPTADAAQRFRILVIDDQRDTLVTMNALLRRLGHEVVVARDGEEGLRVAQEVKPDVIFSDIGLPGIDGYTFARRVRSNPELQSRHLIAVTGYGQDADQRRALDAGFDAHITKPVPLAELVRMLGEVRKPGVARPESADSVADGSSR